MRRFRFGVVAWQAASRRAWTEKARQAEDLGYSTLLVPDHFGDHVAPLVALAAAAQATTTLRFGTLVLDNDFRHPAVVAKEAATLDVLSDGRFELGLGAGWLTSDYEQTGIPFEPPGVRVGRLAEAIAVIKGLWSDAPLTLAGAHYRVTGLDGRPKPAQRPRPPILVGAGGPRMLGIAAHEADIIGLIPRTLRQGGAT